MNRFIWNFLCLICFSFQSVAQQDKNIVENNNINSSAFPIATYDDITMWKNWAFFACVSEIYKESEVVQKDTRYALYAYFELGKGLEVYTQLNELLTDYLKGVPYLGHTNQGGELMLIGGNDEIKIMKCIDFYLSEELDNFIKHYEELSAQVVLMNNAIIANDMDKLQELFINKDLNDKQFIPMTVYLLSTAIDLENFQAIKTLIELGVNADAENQAVGSNLEYIFNFKQNDIRYLKAILYGGLSPNYKRDTSESLLHIAVTTTKEPIKEIIERNYKTQKQQKNTKIKEKINFEHLKLLIEHGANINIENNEKKTALDYAVEQNKTEIALFLVEKGAKFSNYTAELIYNALYRLEQKTQLFKNFIKLRDLMILQGIDYSPKIPDPDAK